jgi:hypothetical protein
LRKNIAYLSFFDFFDFVVKFLDQYRRAKMSKAHRGKGLREIAANGRGECPVCLRNNVKVIYEIEAGGGKAKICKTCRAAVKHGKRTINLPETAAAAPEAAEEKASFEKASA